MSTTIYFDHTTGTVTPRWPQTYGGNATLTAVETAEPRPEDDDDPDETDGDT